MDGAVHRVVFLFDVDNTLLDNDRVAADLRRYLTGKVGAERQERYWAIFEDLRREVMFASFACRTRLRGALCRSEPKGQLKRCGGSGV